jgi:predicted DNA-binding transcriptional regulator AlpA
MRSSPQEEGISQFERRLENCSSEEVAVCGVQMVAALVRGESERTKEQAKAGNSVEDRRMDSRVTADGKPRKISRILSFKELKTLKGIPYSRTHINRLIKEGKFPASFALNPERPGRIGWWEDEIDDWLRARAEGRPWRSEKS